MSIEDDFYATLKFKSGEEIFAKVAASEEEGRTMLLIHNPILICEIRAKSGIVGYKVEPWLKTSREDMFVINLSDVLTLSESNDLEMIMLHQNMKGIWILTGVAKVQQTCRPPIVAII